jgi:serine/threonine-protein kinase
VADESLLNAAARIADGEAVDLVSITNSLPSEEDRATAEELALVAKIAAGHRELHKLLPDIPDTPQSLMPDRARWAHLELLNTVGRGSYGTVYRAWDTRLERLVALKLFHGAKNPEAVMQEGRMLARIRHEHVVTVYGADVTDGVAGIWMELVHGHTLDNIVKAEGPMSAREAAAVGVDVARALGAVHAAGVLHCDIKAQNVVREASGRVVVTDLSAGRVAADYHDSDTVSDVTGTPLYMAPELFRSGSKSTTATDIYAFGVLMYFLLSGKFPVAGKTLGELRKAHESGAGRTLGEAMRGLPAPLVDAVTKAIAHDPNERPQSIGDLQLILAPIAAAPPVGKTGRWSRWWLVAPLVVFALAIAAPVFRPALFTTLPPANTLAVMPIRNLTGDPARQFLADGLTETLIARLAQMPELQVASSATMATVRGATDSNRSLADALGVRLLLAGSVVQVDDRVRINVTLDDPRAGRALWGTELERPVDQIVSAGEEIAKLVAARMGTR